MYNVITDVSPTTFKYWSGAKDTVKYLTDAELEAVWEILYDMYPETPTDTDINDFFWFETDMIADFLGYESFDEIMKRDDLDED